MCQSFLHFFFFPFLFFFSFEIKLDRKEEEEEKKKFKFVKNSLISFIIYKQTIEFKFIWIEFEINDPHYYILDVLLDVHVDYVESIGY